MAAPNILNTYSLRWFLPQLKKKVNNNCAQETSSSISAAPQPYAALFWIPKARPCQTPKFSSASAPCPIAARERLDPTARLKFAAAEWEQTISLQRRKDFLQRPWRWFSV